MKFRIVESLGYYKVQSKDGFWDEWRDQTIELDSLERAKEMLVTLMEMFNAGINQNRIWNVVKTYE